jgi:hypothetical protein
MLHVHPPPNFECNVLPLRQFWLHHAPSSMATRLEVLEGKMLECGSYQMNFGALISELAILNSNVRALTDAMHVILKYSQENMQHEPKVDADKALAMDKSIGKTDHPSPPPKLTESGGAERTRYYTRVHSGGWTKEAARGPTPPHSELARRDNLQRTCMWHPTT